MRERNKKEETIETNIPTSITQLRHELRGTRYFIILPGQQTAIGK